MFETERTKKLNNLLLWLYIHILEMSKVNGGKVESFSRIKIENGRLAMGEDEVRRIWKGYFYLYNIDTPPMGGGFRICPPLIHVGCKRRTKCSRASRLGTHSLFLTFVLPSVFCSFLPLLAHQLPGLGWEVSPSDPIHIFFALLPPLFFPFCLFFDCCALISRSRDKVYA